MSLCPGHIAVYNINKGETKVTVAAGLRREDQEQIQEIAKNLAEPNELEQPVLLFRFACRQI